MKRLTTRSVPPAFQVANAHRPLECERAAVARQTGETPSSPVCPSHGTRVLFAEQISRIFDS